MTQNFQKLTAVAVAAANISIGVFGCAQDDVTTLQIKNSGAHPLTAFDVYARVHPDADYMKIASIAADYTAPSGLILLSRKSDNTALSFVTLAAGVQGVLIVDTRGFESIKLMATAAASPNDTTLDLYANGGG